MYVILTVPVCFWIEEACYMFFSKIDAEYINYFDICVIGLKNLQANNILSYQIYNLK